jgi:hypothetical protein
VYWAVVLACVYRARCSEVSCLPGPGVADPVACSCFPGFGGASCSLHEYSTCHQRGVITTGGTCVCALGFSGDFCEIRDVPEVRYTPLGFPARGCFGHARAVVSECRDVTVPTVLVLNLKMR